MNLYVLPSYSNTKPSAAVETLSSVFSFCICFLSISIASILPEASMALIASPTSFFSRSTSFPWSRIKALWKALSTSTPKSCTISSSGLTAFIMMPLLLTISFAIRRSSSLSGCSLGIVLYMVCSVAPGAFTIRRISSFSVSGENPSPLSICSKRATTNSPTVSLSLKPTESIAASKSLIASSTILPSSSAFRFTKAFPNTL